MLPGSRTLANQLGMNGKVVVAPVTDAPALEGGSVPDGLYRLERGTENARALLIKGKSILEVGSLWGNIQGTWKMDGNHMVITTTDDDSACWPGTSDGWHAAWHRRVTWRTDSVSASDGELI